jgi:hypothetical protein
MSSIREVVGGKKRSGLIALMSEFIYPVIRAAQLQ